MTPSRKSEVETLLRMAAGDARAFAVLSQTKDVPPSRAGFMAQQFVEKALKAGLVAAGGEAPRSHDLVELVNLLKGRNLGVPVTDDELDALTQYSVNLRYNDEEGDPLTLEEIRHIVERIGGWAENVVKVL